MSERSPLASTPRKRPPQNPRAPKSGVSALTPQEAAFVLGRSVATLARWRVTGEGPAFVRPKSRLVRYRLVDLEAFLGTAVRSTTEADSRDAAREAAREARR